MSKQPLGTITTLLDLTDRDAQENYLYPLTSEISRFNRAKERKVVAFTPQIQTILFRGPAAFGQRFTFDIGSLLVGDLIYGANLQIKLGHWLDKRTLNMLAAGEYRYTDVSTAWEYANGLGASCIAQAELEINGKTLETIDGDFINAWSLLSSDYNTQVGTSYDHLARLPISLLKQVGTPGLLPTPRAFPTEDGYIHCPLHLFFSRVRYQEALSLISIKEGNVRLHITLRPFSEVVRQVRGYRDSCTSVPINSTISFTDKTGAVINIPTIPTIPAFESISLITAGAILDGDYRQTLLRKPFEALHRELQTFYFDEPVKYVINKRSDNLITIQLPIEANHPIEEIIWFIRRKGVSTNNEWLNWTDKLETEWPVGTNPKFRTRPLLVNAKIQVNGITLIEAEEQYFRQQIASKHRGGQAAFSNYIYGLSFAETPGIHQPTGSINASRANSLRLTLDIRPPGGVLDASWEVKVFCNAINWMRFENGLANPVFED
jgi:hypothetical protein